jgi:hypothetical protein
MPSTNSGGPEKVDAMPSERVVGMAQNEWTASIGIDGRHGPDYAIYSFPSMGTLLTRSNARSSGGQQGTPSASKYASSVGVGIVLTSRVM